MLSKTSLTLAALVCSLLSPHWAMCQPNSLKLKQDHDGGMVTNLTTAELAKLGDPFFNLLLKDKANLAKLSEITKAIQSDENKHQIFVVDERIVSNQQASASRRSVIAFKGANGSESLDGNVMLSVFFTSIGYGAAPEIEVLGWDSKRGRYNYYKLDSDGTPPGAPAGSQVWKFRATSEGAEQLSAMDRQGSCLRCHISGAPLMKELFFPWNNWHAGVGGSFQADYLERMFAGGGKWPAANTDPFKQLAEADVLEDDILRPLFKRFAKSRLNSTLELDGNGDPVETAGRRKVARAKQLLTPLFKTNDVNLYSSRGTSGLHLFDSPGSFAANASVPLPRDQFFLNTDLIAGGGEGALAGLEITESRDFQGFAKITQQENKDLIDANMLKLNSVAGKDAKFSWLVPGAAYVDNALISECLQQGVITPHFLAAALAIDVETPVFSKKRAELLSFLPDTLQFEPGDLDLTLPRNPAIDFLTAAVVAKIDAAAPAAGSTADEFRSLLKSADAVAELKSRVQAYSNRVKQRLDPANATNRKGELQRLFQIVLERRKAMLADPNLGNLDETGGRLLFPLP